VALPIVAEAAEDSLSIVFSGFFRRSKVHYHYYDS
jgi:hypothetical protein